MLENWISVTISVYAFSTILDSFCDNMSILDKQ